MSQRVNKLRVKCMRCDHEWHKEASFSWGPEDFTSSLCDTCFREVISPIIHKKQRKEGNFDCFGRPTDFCDQFECKYRDWCLRWGTAEKRDKKVASSR